VDLQLAGRVAIVTGGSGAIGRVVTEHLVAEGASVVICGRRSDVLEETAAALRSATGGSITAIAADTRDTGSVEQLVARTVAELGGVDILVNNAAAPGGLVGGDIVEADEALLEADLDTKLMGYFRTLKAVAPVMKQRGFGRVVNIGGLSGRAGGTISGMRNLALVHLTRTTADQLGPNGITVNIVHPGAVESEYMTSRYRSEAERRGIRPEDVEAEMVAHIPVRRMVTPADIARLVCFLSSPLSDGISGSSIAVDGGATRGMLV
jgi:NAD(P)-dependent dehydrogenase (short-subunit alcohol dehydrogenase family)